jgi:hypothetical protein
MKCEKCSTNYYSNNNQCHKCPTGFTSEEGSIECIGNNEIPTCSNGEIPYHNKCVTCDKAMSNCETCSYNSTQNKNICTQRTKNYL